MFKYSVKKRALDCYEEVYEHPSAHWALVICLPHQTQGHFTAKTGQSLLDWKDKHICFSLLHSLHRIFSSYFNQKFWAFCHTHIEKENQMLLHYSCRCINPFVFDSFHHLKKIFQSFNVYVKTKPLKIEVNFKIYILKIWEFTHGYSGDWRGIWQPTPVFLPRESFGQRSLVGCCPWGRPELDMTEVT